MRNPRDFCSRLSWCLICRIQLQRCLDCSTCPQHVLIRQIRVIIVSNRFVMVIYYVERVVASVIVHTRWLLLSSALLLFLKNPTPSRSCHFHFCHFCCVIKWWIKADDDQEVYTQLCFPTFSVGYTCSDWLNFIAHVIFLLSFIGNPVAFLNFTALCLTSSWWSAGYKYPLFILPPALPLHLFLLPPLSSLCCFSYYFLLLVLCF